MYLLSEFKDFCLNLISSRKLLIALSVDNFKQEYFGSYLGLLWALIRPLIFLSVIWFVFEVGFKAAPRTNGSPFIVWLATGFSAWFFFSEALSNGVYAVMSKSFLVRKVDFRVSILPVTTILSSLIIHLIFLSIVVVIFFANGVFPTIYWLQLPFYTISLFFLLLGLVWLVSSVRVFVKDVGYVVGIVLQVGFWATPIFWSVDLVPDRFLFFIKLNPMYFIVSGYRDSLISQIWFWERGLEVVVFWFISVFVFIAGAIVFKRLRPHFGDVL